MSLKLLVTERSGIVQDVVAPNREITSDVCDHFLVAALERTNDGTLQWILRRHLGGRERGPLAADKWMVMDAIKQSDENQMFKKLNSCWRLFKILACAARAR